MLNASGTAALLLRYAQLIFAAEDARRS